MLRLLALAGVLACAVAIPLPGHTERAPARTRCLSMHGAAHAHGAQKDRHRHLSEGLRAGKSPARLRDAAKVVLGNITSFAGFFTVDVEKASNMFFWHFPALSGDEKAPLLIWLQGGPGASSMFSLFHEIGPYALEQGAASGQHSDIRLSQRALSWNNRYALLFIDNPVGAGFSYTESRDGYPSTEEAVAAHLLSVVQQFYLVFPGARAVPLYLTGESYAGHYIPALGSSIHKHNAALDQGNPAFIPLAGLAIGDGWIDPLNMVRDHPNVLEACM